MSGFRSEASSIDVAEATRKFEKNTTALNGKGPSDDLSVPRYEEPGPFPFKASLAEH
jgi:hypothetical protein